MTPITWEGEGVILIMYNLISLNWHVSDSQNNYTSKQGLCLQTLDVYDKVSVLLFLVIYICMINRKTFQGFKAK